MSSTPTSSSPARPDESPVPLSSILCTEELYRRPPRSPDYQTENRALAALARALADSPDTILQVLVDTILEVVQADSAGLSLLATHDGGKTFYWPAFAGAWRSHVGGGTLRDFGPCGDVLDANRPLLFKHFERRYSYLRAAWPLAEEALLIPFRVKGKPVGTIWVMAHDERRRFDAEDLRQLESVGRFASAAYQAVILRQTADSRRAALNLMEDAVQARQEVEILNWDLRESERRYREMIDALPAAVYTTDAKGLLTHYNPAAVEFSGRTPALGSDKWCVSWKLYRPDGTLLPHDECPMAIALKEGRAVCGAEAIAERPDGTRLWFQPYPTPLLNREGEVVGGINMLVDITEKKRAEDSVRRGEEQFRNQIEQVKDYAIFRTDTKGCALTWNQGVERILDLREEDFVGKDIGQLIFTPEDMDSGVPQAELDAAAASGTAVGDRWMRRKSGERFFAGGVTTALRDDTGKLVGFTKVMRDMTEQRRMEGQIQRQRDELAGESRRKDEFLAMLSHELRNPLAPIQSAAQLLRMHGGSGDNPILGLACKIIERQVGNLTKLVDDLLDVARVTSGRINLGREILDLNQVVDHALQTTNHVFEQRRHVVSIQHGPEPVWVDGDSTRLEEVFINLLNNAAKFTPDGGSIEVACERLPGQESVQIRVRDDGIGIDQEILPRIFDLFTQADRSLARSAGGLGIGLSLVQRLIELHGGTIEAHSPPRGEPGGRGTELTVTLPLAPAPDAAALVEPTSVVTDAATDEVRDPMRVLVVDDNDDLVELVEISLRQKGYSVQSAHDGPGALEAAKTWRPDVILLDIGLPGLSGYEVARRLRADSAHFGPGGYQGKLIALTGYGRDTDTAQASDAGFDAHLVKPYAFDRLEALMRSART